MTEAAPRNAFHRIRGVQVKGGFLDGLHVEFDDNLNCLIGGRGTGKTTVLEILRWTLDQMPDRKDDSTLFRNIDRLIQANLGNGQVEVDIETRAGLRYRVRRASGNTALVMNEGGDPVEIDIGRGSIFSAEVYSQNQIEEIANDPLFQLKLIDKFVTEEIKEIDAQIAVRVRELRANAGEVIKLRGDVTTLKEKVALLPEVLEKLKAFKIEEDDEEATVIRKAGEGKALRDRERRALERLQQVFSNTAVQLREAVTDLPGAVDELVDQAILDGPNGTLFQQIRDLAAAGASDVHGRVEEAARIAEESRSRLQEKGGEASALHLTQEKAYQDLLEAREKEKDKATERDKLLRRRSELLEEQKRLEKRTEELRAKEEARTSLLRRLSDLKDARFGHRTRVAETLSSQLTPTIRVQIEQHGNTDSYRDLLLEAMKGSGFKYTQVVDRVVQRIPPHELAATVQRGDVQAAQRQLLLPIDDNYFAPRRGAPRYGNRRLSTPRGGPVVLLRQAEVRQRALDRSASVLRSVSTPPRRRLREERRANDFRIGPGFELVADASPVPARG